ncbi:Proteasome component [Gracilaria domingensis]|nr:Proteasome component [Gracilaria domingensis]
MEVCLVYVGGGVQEEQRAAKQEQIVEGNARLLGLHAFLFELAQRAGTPGGPGLLQCGGHMRQTASEFDGTKEEHGEAVYSKHSKQEGLKGGVVVDEVSRLAGVSGVVGAHDDEGERGGGRGGGMAAASSRPASRDDGARAVRGRLPRRPQPPQPEPPAPHLVASRRARRAQATRRAVVAAPRRAARLARRAGQDARGRQHRRRHHAARRARAAAPAAALLGVRLHAARRAGGRGRALAAGVAPAHRRWVGACRHAARVVVDTRNVSGALALIRPLRLAADKLAPSPDCIVPIHADFLAVCLQAKCYRMAAAWLRERRRLRIDPVTAVQASDVHLMYHYAAVVFIGVKDYPAALQCCRLALAVPAPTPGPFFHVALGTFKYYMLLHLLVSGRAPQPFKFSSYQLSRLRNLTSEYAELAVAYERMDRMQTQQVFESNRHTFEKHGNLGVVKQVMRTLTDALIERLTNSFVTMKIENVATRLGYSDEQEVHDVIVRMIEEGKICARIDDRKHVVRLVDDSGRVDDGLFAQVSGGLMQQSLQVLQRVDEFREKLQSDPAYVGKMMSNRSQRRGMGASSSTKRGDAELMRLSGSLQTRVLREGGTETETLESDLVGGDTLCLLLISQLEMLASLNNSLGLVVAYCALKTQHDLLGGLSLCGGRGRGRGRCRGESKSVSVCSVWVGNGKVKTHSCGKRAWSDRQNLTACGRSDAFPGRRENPCPSCTA